MSGLRAAIGMNDETPSWRELKAMAEGHRVRFLGPIYGPMLIESLHLGGHALLEAMGVGDRATPFNREDIADAGESWTKDVCSLADLIRWADANPDAVREAGVRAQDRIRTHYTWDGVADAHDRSFRATARRHGFAVEQALATEAG